MIRIFIYHERPLISRHISHVLNGESDFEIIGQSHALENDFLEGDLGESSSVDQIFAQLLNARCDILLISYTLPKAKSYQLLQSINRLPFACKVIMIGVVNKQEAILDCLEEGADGYVCENEQMAELVKKIRSLVDDEFIIDPHISASLIARISQLKQLVNELDGGNMPRPLESYAELTKREWEILRLLGEECSNQQIAKQLTIELGTVKNHVHNLLGKLDVCSRKQAAQLSRQLFVRANPSDKELTNRENGSKNRSNNAASMLAGWQASSLTI